MKIDKKQIRTSINGSVYKAAFIYCIIRTVVNFLIYNYDYLLLKLNNSYCYNIKIIRTWLCINTKDIIISIAVSLLFLPFFNSLLRVVNYNKKQTKRFFIYLFEDFGTLFFLFIALQLPSLVCSFLAKGFTGEKALIIRILLGTISIIFMCLFNIASILLVRLKYNIKKCFIVAFNLFFKNLGEFIVFYLSFLLWGLLFITIFFVLVSTHFNRDWAMILFNSCIWGLGIFYYPYYNKCLMVFIDNLIKIDNKS